MRSLSIDCELDYDIWQPSTLIFNIEVPSSTDQTVVSERIAVNPPAATDAFVDPSTGNRFLRVRANVGPLNVRYLAGITGATPNLDEQAPEVPIADLPLECVAYLLASRYCESDILFDDTVQLFGHVAPGYRRVQYICQWIRDNIEYRVGTSSPLTTSRDVLQNQAGVCRDYAHLAIAFCRALNIPARFVTGYARYSDPPPDFHAIFEAYLGDRWHLFDPTLLAPLDEIVRIGTGRDASEVAFATFYGTVRMRKLSPLIEPSGTIDANDPLTELQRPDSGLILSA